MTLSRIAVPFALLLCLALGGCDLFSGEEDTTIRALRVPIAPNPDDGELDVTPERMREAAFEMG